MRAAASLALAAMPVVAPAVGAGPDFASMQVAVYDPPKPPPPLALPDLVGKMDRLQDLRGKVVLVFCWTTW